MFLFILGEIFGLYRKLTFYCIFHIQLHPSVQLLCLLRSKVHIYGRCPVQRNVISKEAFLRSVDIKSQLSHHLAYQSTRFQYLHLIVEAACHRESPHVLQCPKSTVSRVHRLCSRVLFLNQYGRRNVIHRRLVSHE